MVTPLSRYLFAGAIVFGILATALPFASLHLILLAATCFVALLGHLAILQWQKRVDPYSLEALRRTEEQEELERIHREHEQLVLDGDIMCPCCGNLYDARIPVCPHCRKSP